MKASWKAIALLLSLLVPLAMHGLMINGLSSISLLLLACSIFNHGNGCS